VPRDPCEIKYQVDIPLIGVEEVGIPVNRITYDAMQAATDRLPQFMPEIYSTIEPYADRLLGRVTEDVIETVEFEAPYLADKLLEEKIMPRAEILKENLIANVENVVEEILVTLLAVGGATIVAVGVGAWWVNRKEEMRDKGR
jgi:hypothetical protein